MKPGQIRQLYLEPRLHKQSNKKSITTGHVWQSDYIQNKQTNVWQTIGPPSNWIMRLLSNLLKICPLWSDEFQKLWSKCQDVKLKLWIEKRYCPDFSIKMVKNALRNKILTFIYLAIFNFGYLNELIFLIQLLSEKGWKILVPLFSLSCLYNNFFSNLSLWASNFLDWLVQIKTSLVQKSLYI